ncbi:BamA/TamA family outer membrane protein [Duganella ginsengisoli]|uniref:BamA/TamA family outer membrane protein n=2 Tax=Pseudoduganella ginsengisoli TaxID=1462440 RepID=A0A6L6Q717_9BURK|nr:BamA/TamA family outer membrane protein [Pseudoduganella ginsengisoli]
MTGHRAPAIFIALAVTASAMAPVRAHAADEFHYSVRINAPGKLDDLLRDNLDVVRFRGNPRMDREQLQRMVRAAPEQVKTLVATEGYFSPAASARIEGDGQPVVVIDVQPGEPVRVDSVDIVLEGFTPNPQSPFDTAALTASWTLPKGDIFRQEDWEKAKRALLRQVVQTRYPRAVLTETEAAVDPERHAAALRLVLDSGPELRFGELRVEGLKRYPPSVVANLNQIKPGDYYSEAALQAYQSRLQDTGYFASVEVSADMSSVLDEQIEAGKGQPAGASPPVLPLLVRVVENKRRNVSAGVGYSTNTGNRAQLNYDDLAVYGLKMKSALTLETKKQTAKVDFYFPTTADGYNDSFGTSYVRSNIEGEETNTFAINARRAWGTPLLERSIALELLTERRDVAGSRGVRSTSLPVTYAVTRRKVDNLLFPTTGHVLSWQLGGALLAEEPFARASVKGLFYIPFDPKNLVLLRGEAGAVISKQKDGIPATYLFRAGGDQSVRGYAYQELGVGEGTATVGGRYLATASVEYQHWLRPAWGGAVFYDAGNAADQLSGLHPKSGYGVGVRWKSPVGPLNVDAAYGHSTKKVRLHFSLGISF